MQQNLSTVDVRRLISRATFINQMRSQLIGSPKADDFNKRFGCVTTWQQNNVRATDIDLVENELRTWLKTNKVVPNGQTPHIRG